MEELDMVVATLSQRREEILEKAPRISHRGLEHPLYYIKDLQRGYESVTGLPVSLDTLILAAQDRRCLLEMHTCESNRAYSIVYSLTSPVSKAIVEKLMMRTEESDSGPRDGFASTRLPNAKRLYDESSDSYESGLSTCTQIVTPSTLRSRIIASFCSRPVLPVDSFSTAYCIANDVMFDYRTSPCPIPSHAHSSLSKFLRCYSDILEFLELKKLYAILKTKEALELNRRRFASHFVEKADPMFRCSMEVLCVNMFSTRTCLPLTDFLELFGHVYKNPLPPLVAPAQPQDFLCSLKSPNVTLMKRNGACTITLTPTHSPEYREWSTALHHKKIRDAEGLLSQGGSSTLSLPHSVVRGEDVLLHNAGDSNVRSLMAIADLNVPKLLQKRTAYIAEGLECGSTWRYLKQGINFDGRRPYFTI